MKVKKHSANMLYDKYKAYEVNSRHCNLNLFDTVTPETIIGFHYKTSRLIRAQRFGRIATMYYNAIHDSLIIMIVTRGDWPSFESEDCFKEERRQIPGLYLG